MYFDVFFRSNFFIRGKRSRLSGCGLKSAPLCGCFRSEVVFREPAGIYGLNQSLRFWRFPSATTISKYLLLGSAREYFLRKPLSDRG